MMVAPSVNRVYDAVVVRVVDGDRVALDVDLGFHTWRHQECRLARVRAPGMTTTEGAAARGFLAEKLQPGTKVLIQCLRIPDETAPAPALVEAWFGPTNLSDLILGEGHAKPLEE